MMRPPKSTRRESTSLLEHEGHLRRKDRRCTVTNSCDEYDDNEALDQSEIESLDDDDLDNSYTDSERYDDEDDRDDLRGTSQCDGTCEPQCDWCLVSHSCPEDCAGGACHNHAREVRKLADGLSQIALDFIEGVNITIVPQFQAQIEAQEPEHAGTVRRSGRYASTLLRFA